MSQPFPLCYSQTPLLLSIKPTLANRRLYRHRTTAARKVISHDLARPSGMANALETVIATFIQHKHPLILVEYHALSWMATLPSYGTERIDLLIRQSQSEVIIESLTHFGVWATTDDRDGLESFSAADRGAIRRLLSTNGNCLTLWPETVYRMTIDAIGLVEVPDFYPLWPSLVERSMQTQWEASPRIRTSKQLVVMKEADKTTAFLGNTKYTSTHPLARISHDPSRSTTITLYIPTILAMFQSSCAQASAAMDIGHRQGPHWHMELLIRYLFLELPEQRARLRAAITDTRTWEEMEAALDGYVRTNKLTLTMTKGGKPWPAWRERKALGLLNGQQLEGTYDSTK